MKSADSSAIACTVCYRNCTLQPGQTGPCRIRKNEDGNNVPVNYGKITSLALDPIEKKPLAHFYPGSMILSAGSYGCNLHCPFCQNWQISQQSCQDAQSASPAQLADLAQDLKGQGNIGIALTYNEPAVNFEYVRDVFKEARKKDLKTVLVTAGCVSTDVLNTFLPYTDAMNIDLKGFEDSFYQWVGGKLDMVKAFIEKAAASCHVEISFLVIPGKNDDIKSMDAMAKWLADISPDIVLHINRYFPRYHLDTPPTPLETMEQLRQTASQYLKHVYLGNV